ncbi:phosphocholine cytidylyltransferase family protein [Fusobacterium sp. SB021]|uniref:phosphocholine cytidylyltransferase family protein n=1 Tax=Fusobacterium sp. SB021 TaxID=2744227 RepID=UPI003CEB70C4
MKAVILAAGIGSRLRPLTDNVPKCMVEVNGIKIIEKQIKSLLNNGIKEIAVVTGYQHEILNKYLNENFPFIEIIDNKEYLKTNNMYSMFLTKKFVNEESFIFMNADVFFEEMIIKELLEDERENLIVCDNENYLEESMKIVLDKNEHNILKISKQISKEESYGTTIDVYKLSSSASEKFFSIINNFIIEKKELNLWTEVAVQELLKQEKFYSKDIAFKWVEIDNLEDLEQAKKLFKGGI